MVIRDFHCLLNLLCHDGLWLVQVNRIVINVHTPVPFTRSSYVHIAVELFELLSPLPVSNLVELWLRDLDWHR